MIGCHVHGDILLDIKTQERAPNILKVKETPASWQGGFWILTDSLRNRFSADASVEQVCQELGISRSAAYAAATMIQKSLDGARASKVRHSDDRSSERECADLRFEIDMLRYELAHPGSRKVGIRIQFDPDYKAFVEDRRACHGFSIERVSQILKIPIDTLKKFPRSVAEQNIPPTGEPETLPRFVIELVNEYLRGQRGAKSVKVFCQRHPELLQRLGMNYRQCLNWLRRLGFVSPRGIFLKNKGLDKILRFKPNQVWGSDGKRMAIIINGEIFEWTWQCLIDGATTVIVGGRIDHAENTENLLEALKDSKRRTGITPLAVVIDNRLSENLPAIRSYLDELGIEIIKTFPGNSKSNGIVEGNFNIFDRWVGPVEINGATPEELSRSLAHAFVEVFTQIRNHNPRKSLSFKSAKEVMDESTPATPEEEALVREKLKAMAERLKNEQTQPMVTMEKQAAIDQAAEITQPPHLDVFNKTLQNARFTPPMILGATAILEQQRKEHPEKNLGHAYFGGILRNLANQQAVETLSAELEAVYVHHWDTMNKLSDRDLAGSLQSRPEATCTRLASDFMNMAIPAFTVPILQDLKTSFLVASAGIAERAAHLRKTIAGLVIQSSKVANARRETLLCRLFEWENFIRISSPRARPGASNAHEQSVTLRQELIPCPMS